MGLASWTRGSAWWTRQWSWRVAVHVAGPAPSTDEILFTEKKNFKFKRRPTMGPTQLINKDEFEINRRVLRLN